MKSAAKLIKIFATVVGLGFLALFLFIGASLAWIAFRPLPHIPRYRVRYSLKDCGPIGNEYLDFFGSDPLNWGWQLTASGAVVCLNPVEESVDEARRSRAISHLARQLNLNQESESTPIVAISSSGDALIFQGDALWLWQRGRFLYKIPREVRGYSWQIYFLRFHKINAQEYAIGNGRIATAPASSGGTSAPHGRFMPLVWNPGVRRPEDLNSQIDPLSGWYLDQAVDINNRGQILCVGRRTNEKGAENYQQEDAHWVVLTPTLLP